MQEAEPSVTSQRQEIHFPINYLSWSNNQPGKIRSDFFSECHLHGIKFLTSDNLFRVPTDGLQGILQLMSTFLPLMGELLAIL